MENLRRVERRKESGFRQIQLSSDMKHILIAYEVAALVLRWTVELVVLINSFSRRRQRAIFSRWGSHTGSLPR